MMVRTFVYDSVHGHPAAGVAVRLRRVQPEGEVTEAEGATCEDGEWEFDADRAHPAGCYRLVLDTAGYFAALGMQTTCREVAVGLQLPLRGATAGSVVALLTPNSITTYVLSSGTR